jgi:hypothetical protein
MACSVNAIPMHEEANAYADIAFADAYFETHPYPTPWVDVGDDEKCRALVHGARMMDTWYEWDGDVSSADQSMLWPRDGVIGPNGYEENSEEVPVRIKQGNCEMANSLLAGNRAADSDVEAQGLSSLSVGNVALEFKGSVTAKPIPDAVANLVSCYGTQRSKYGAAGAVTLFRA